MYVAALLCGVPDRARAEDAAKPDPYSGIEEMIVTGAAAVDVLAPPSTSAIEFDTDALRSIGVQDVGDLADYVPNLEIATVNATNASFFIRGVGLQDFGANASSSVPIFQDGIPRNASATQLVGLYDIGAISVLKGPQGSGNRRNASAGAFIVNATAPEPDNTGYARMTLARIGSVDARDANRYAFEAASNTPVYGDVVSARISARYTHENPFWENRCANRTPIADRTIQRLGAPSVAICGETVPTNKRSSVTPFLSRYVGEVDDYGLRGQIRFKPSDAIDWTTRVEISNLNRDSTTGQALGTGGNRLGGTDFAAYRDSDIARREVFLFNDYRATHPTATVAQARRVSREVLAKELRKDPLDRKPFAGEMNQQGRTLLETHSASTTGVMDFDAVDVTTNLGFLDYRKSESRDQDITPNEKFGSISNDQGWELYGDLALSGEEIGVVPISWKTGVYAMHEKIESQNQQDLGRFDANGVRQTTDYEQEIESFGLFAEGSYDLAEGLILSGGVRYNWEQKDFDVKTRGENDITGGSPNPIIVTQIFDSRNQRTWDAATGFVNLEYDFTEEITTYLKYSRGWKAGHFNPSDARAAKVPGQGFADPESLDAVEWGLKANAFANRLQTSGTFFFYNYSDYQVFRLTTNFAGVSRVVQNAKRARNFGAELEIVGRPLEGFVPEAIEGLNVTLRGGWLEAQFVEFTVVEQRLFGGGSFGVPIDYSGNSLLNAPRLQATAIVVWPIVTNRFGTITPQYDMTWTDDVPFDPNNGKGEPEAGGADRFPAYTVGTRAYTLHNVRLTWAPPGESGIEVAGWCRNLTDLRYKTFAVDLSTFSSQQLVYVGDPRTCGADVRFTW